MNTSIQSRPKKRVKGVKFLQFDSLMGLIDNRNLVLRIPGFFPTNYCEMISAKMWEEPTFERYSMAEDVPVRRIGMTLFETEQKKRKLNQYFREAIHTSEKLRSMCAPCLNPLDLLRLRLEEIWPGGAQIMTIRGKKMLPGIARMFEADARGGLPPHQDILGRDMPNLPKEMLPTAQLAANIYLEVAPKGGELELWDFAPSCEEFLTLMDGQYDFLDRAKLPPSEALLKPRMGELIIMRSDKVHAVHPSFGGSRLAMSCFIGYFGIDKPLTYWA
ncbi:MAG: 2OG-Fe(II) oxygenase [Bacteroidota bacterium]